MMCLPMALFLIGPLPPGIFEARLFAANILAPLVLLAIFDFPWKQIHLSHAGVKASIVPRREPAVRTQSPAGAVNSLDEISKTGWPTEWIQNDTKAYQYDYR